MYGIIFVSENTNEGEHTDFIANTGIQDIRQSYTDKEDQKKLKQKQRDKIHPKMNIMNIDYQVLIKLIALSSFAYFLPFFSCQSLCLAS